MRFPIQRSYFDTSGDTLDADLSRITRLWGYYDIRWDGTVAGAIAATGVLLSVFIIDLLKGDPISTPLAWWSAAASLFNLGTYGQPPIVGVVGYAVLTYVVWIALGELATAIVFLVRTDPSARFSAFSALVLAELMILCFIEISYESTFTGETTWVQLITANVVGLALMATTLTLKTLHRRVRRPRSTSPATNGSPRRTAEARS
jgi:hypothetical protein